MESLWLKLTVLPLDKKCTHHNNMVCKYLQWLLPMVNITMWLVAKSCLLHGNHNVIMVMCNNTYMYRGKIVMHEVYNYYTSRLGYIP